MQEREINKLKLIFIIIDSKTVSSAALLMYFLCRGRGNLRHSKRLTWAFGGFFDPGAYCMA